jgi:hypothetical protein
MAPRKQFLLRLDPALYAELEAWAAGELRSVNGQMEYLLRQAVTAHRGGRRAATARGDAAPAGSPASAAGSAPAESPGESSAVLTSDEATTMGE